MKKQLVILGIVVLFLVVGFSGCQEISVIDEEDRFVGRWIDDKGYVKDFFANGTYITYSSWGNNSYQWILKDEKLVLNTAGMVTALSYVFSDNDNTLTLYLSNWDEPASVWTRQ